MADLKSILDNLEKWLATDDEDVILSREEVTILRGAAAHHYQACEGRIVYREMDGATGEAAPEKPKRRRLDGSESTIA